MRQRRRRTTLEKLATDCLDEADMQLIEDKTRIRSKKASKAPRGVFAEIGERSAAFAQ
jgi:hypothetical protein